MEKREMVSITKKELDLLLYTIEYILDEHLMSEETMEDLMVILNKYNGLY